MSFIDWLTGEPKRPEREPLPIYDDETAIRYVRALGYAVIKAKQPPQPRVGECWTPVKAARAPRAGKVRKAPPAPRYVQAIGIGFQSEFMGYSLQPDGEVVVITLATWQRWRKGTRAVKTSGVEEPK